MPPITEERKAYLREYRKKNKVILAKKARKRYVEHREEKLDYNHKYYDENKEEILIQVSEYYSEHKEEKIAYAKEYRVEHKEDLAEKAKIYDKTRKEERKVYMKEYNTKYYKKNKSKINAQMLDRKKKNPMIRIANNLRSGLLHAIKNEYKSGSAVRDLGCSIDELKNRFELLFYTHPKTGEEMTWDNYGEKWHIDHIVPLIVFDLTIGDHLIFACHYTNLQPLWMEHNESKKDKIMTWQEIEELKRTVI